jgi:thiamine-phosphate diphosphorylase
MEIEMIQRAVKILQNSDNLAELIPEVRSNLVMARENASETGNVAGIPGRITTIKGRIRIFVEPDWGASSHMARLVLAVMEHDPERRSAMNIRYHPLLIEICEKLGLQVSFYNREEEPDDIRAIEGGTIPWGVEQAIQRMGGVPDVIYHTGDWGKEPSIVLIGGDAVDVAKMAVCIAQLFQVRGGPRVLFAPSRKSYLEEKFNYKSKKKSHDILEEKSHDNCIFCRISADDPAIKKLVLYKDKYNMVLLNPFPYNRGHLEVVPRKHFTDINQLNPEELKNLFLLVQKSIVLIREVIKPDGINLGINLGEAAGATIEHLHLHLVPRFWVETGFIETITDTRVIEETLDHTYARFKEKIEILRDDH